MLIAIIVCCLLLGESGTGGSRAHDPTDAPVSLLTRPYDVTDSDSERSDDKIFLTCTVRHVLQCLLRMYGEHGLLQTGL